MNQKTKPNFFVVGAAKSGTTSLYHYLKAHPEIYMSSIKEPHYFSTDINPEEFSDYYKKSLFYNIDKYLNGEMEEEIHTAFIRNQKNYLKLFKNVTDEKAVGEVSNSYLYSRVAAHNIRKFNPNAKIIIILRNPIERAFSNYLMDLNLGYTKESSFIDAIKKTIEYNKGVWGKDRLYLEIGLYHEQVKRYLRKFDRKNIKVILFDNFRNDTASVLTEIYHFLDVNSNFQPNYQKKYNISLVPKYKLLNKILWKTGVKRFLSKIKNGKTKLFFKDMMFYKKKNMIITYEERKFLKNYFRDDITKLSRLINYNLSRWLDKN